ncbi:hypothetical protein QBC47DRAFT_140963 [Echria macrotheca]|uniref:Uncharacterized protein n=1 Tax=Echria macrotheca TaxID=438768 RepID=A0AAJ0BHP9_9PEZI|nr:hypothetical protein QBC47DRAFT_140963 [Echria macrotheca]
MDRCPGNSTGLCAATEAASGSEMRSSAQAPKSKKKVQSQPTRRTGRPGSSKGRRVGLSVSMCGRAGRRRNEAVVGSSWSLLFAVTSFGSFHSLCLRSLSPVPLSLVTVTMTFCQKPDIGATKQRYTAETQPEETRPGGWLAALPRDRTTRPIDEIVGAHTADAAAPWGNWDAHEDGADARPRMSKSGHVTASLQGQQDRRRQPWVAVSKPSLGTERS